jgi:hypothetical protein
MYAKKILPSMLTKSPKTYLPGEQSFAQVRGGITRPQICAFVPDKPFTIAVVGFDNYGNGCLMLSSFGSNQDKCDDDTQSSDNVKPVRGQAKRLSFHRFFKKGLDKNNRLKSVRNNVYTGDSQVVCSDDVDLATGAGNTIPNSSSTKGKNNEEEFVNITSAFHQTDKDAVDCPNLETSDVPQAAACDIQSSEENLVEKIANLKI